MVHLYNPNVVGKQIVLDGKNIESNRLSLARAGAARSGSPFRRASGESFIRIPRHLACRRGASQAWAQTSRQERVCVVCVLCHCVGWELARRIYWVGLPLARTRARGDKPRAGTGHVPPAG